MDVVMLYFVFGKTTQILAIGACCKERSWNRWSQKPQSSLSSVGSRTRHLLEDGWKVKQIPKDTERQPPSLTVQWSIHWHLRELSSNAPRQTYKTRHFQTHAMMLKIEDAWCLGIYCFKIKVPGCNTFSQENGHAGGPGVGLRALLAAFWVSFCASVNMRTGQVHLRLSYLLHLWAQLRSWDSTLRASKFPLKSCLLHCLFSDFASRSRCFRCALRQNSTEFWYRERIDANTTTGLID